MALASSSMRSKVRALLLINGSILLFILSRIFDLTTQLNDGALMNLAVTREELRLDNPVVKDPPLSSSGSQITAPRTQIPRIIHQTYKTNEVPPAWREVQETIKESNPDYEYVLWTDESARDFLAQHYPWFLKTFDGYRYPIMRADALRYFVLYHFGGFYVDLDIGVKTSLDELRQLPSFFYKTSPTGVSNDMMACIPRHQFMAFVIRNLQKYDCNYLVPYLTVMYSTGPLFLSVLLQRYNLWVSRTGDSMTRIFVLRDAVDSVLKPLADFVFHVDGSSWHQGDAPLFTFVNKHLLLSIILIAMAIIASIALIFYVELRLVKIVLRALPRRLPQLAAQNRMKQA